MVGEENCGRRDVVLLCNSNDTLVLEERRACAAERAVGGDVNALLLAEVNNLLLGQKRVVLDLVGSRNDGGLREQLLEVLDGVVGNTDGLDLLRVCLDQLLEVLPCVDVCNGMINVTAAVLELREKRVVSYRTSTKESIRESKVLTIRVHGHRPVHEIEVNIGCLE